MKRGKSEHSPQPKGLGDKKIAANSRPPEGARCEQRRPRTRKGSGARPPQGGIGRVQEVIPEVKRLNPYWVQE